VEEITLTINGRKVKAKQGMTVLEAAQANGIYIPTICHDPDLEPYGACRLCVVEIDNMRGLPTSCTTPATDGMVVHTETPAVNKVRCTAIDLLIADHPMDCLTGVNAIEIVSRGYPTRVSTFRDQLLLESICRSCGECMVRCPVAALIPYNFPQPTEEVATICPYCGVGCQMYLGIRGGEVVSTRGSREGSANKGKLCAKGRFGIAEFIHHPERLTTPLVKQDGEFIKTTWDMVLDMMAKKFANYHPDEVAVISSAKCTNEDNYVAQKFARAVLGTNNVDHCARL